MQEEQKPQVLLIDDEEIVRELLQKFLERHGYRVQTAKDGLEALNIIQDTNIGIIISDIVMPRMDGLEFLQRIREFNQTAQIIMITGQPSLDAYVGSIENSACEYLIKPVEREEILKSVQLAESNLKGRQNHLHDNI